jgi:hypothetical protein
MMEVKSRYLWAGKSGSSMGPWVQTPVSPPPPPKVATSREEEKNKEKATA